MTSDSLPKRISAKQFIEFHCAQKQFKDVDMPIRDQLWTLRFYCPTQTQSSAWYDETTMQALASYKKTIGAGKDPSEADKLAYLASTEGRDRMNTIYAAIMIFNLVYDPDSDKPLFPSLNSIWDMEQSVINVIYKTLVTTISEYSINVDTLTEPEMERWLDWLHQGITPSFFLSAATDLKVFSVFTSYLASQIFALRAANSSSITTSSPESSEPTTTPAPPPLMP